ncbi:UDP-glucose 4-epimerase GalE [Sphingobacteriales bacterium UPWRP_1]|nr:UDP-glucose 4-epimerase GalE [Sphingobacteriales bacterium TSM_CSM]PSJ76783.1 UDP-glucose 4-epimerase GalE [Sphingobacteriales bacterium UPWRP_1]
MKILVTGGCGYIGAHTIVDLLENGFEVICIDDNSRSGTGLLRGAETIGGRSVPHYRVNLCNLEETHRVFSQHPQISGIIHFAAYKSVPESVNNPLLYYHNNLASLVNLLQCVQAFNVPNFVFSSSCSVYGNAPQLPVTEETPLQKAESPYGNTKQIGEEIIADVARTSKNNFILLRYFNPVGAHPSALIGELQENPENLVPIITQTAIGKRPRLTVYGNDYPTRDGSCIRDYIHVMDIANAHTKALQYLLAQKNKANCEVFNLGSGNGTTVLEAIAAFEGVSGLALNYVIGPRRAGDVVAIYANNQKAANLLGWHPRYTLEDMMRTAWQWELKLKSTTTS